MKLIVQTKIAPFSTADEFLRTFERSLKHLRLDYVFAPEADAPRVHRCDVVAPARAQEASDHLPLLAEIDADAIRA